MRAIRILLAVAAAAVALVVVAALALVVLVDPNDYKSYATAWVEERTGRSFAIEGDLELAFFPWLALETERVVLGQPPGVDVAEPFATVEGISARVKLLPLLRRRFEIGSVQVEGLRLNLARSPEGSGNWEDFDAGPQRTDDSSAAALVENLDIERIDIRGGEVRWYEEPSRPRYILSNLALATGRVRAGEPVEASLGVDVEDAATERRFAVETRALIGLELLRAASEDAIVTLTDVSLGLRAYDPTSGELGTGTLEAARLDAFSDGRVVIGTARVDGMLAAMEARPAGLDLGAAWDELRFDPRAGSFGVDGLSTRVAGITAQWRIDARDVIDAPRLEGELRAADAPVAAALETFGVALPAGLDPSTLGGVDASARFRVALSLADASDTDAAEPGPPSAQAFPVIGPYRLDELTLDGLAVDVLGTTLRGDAALDDDGMLRGTFDIPEHAPSDALRALAAAHVPDALDLDALDRIALSATVELGLADGRLVLPSLRAALLGAELVASLDAPPAQDGAARVLRGTLRTTPIDPERLASLLAELMPAAISPAELGTLSVDTRFEHDAAADRIVLDDVALEAFGLAATGSVVVDGLGDGWTATGTAELASFSPRALMERFGQPVPETSDPSTLQRAVLAASFEADADGGRFRDIDLTLDDTRITGEYAIDGLANPAHRFTLAIDRVNADRYLPPRAADVPDDDDDTRTAGDIELPAEALARLRLDGEVTVGDLRLAGLEFQNVGTRIVVGDGRATLDSARASLYGGEFVGRFEVDTTEQPRLSLTGRATSLALEPIITALTGDANFSGTGDFDLDLAGSGATVLENVASANGRVAFSMRDGAIEGFNLGRALCVVYNTARRLPAPAEQRSRTAYVSIGGTATVQDGVASSRDLLARTTFMDLTGTGHLALAEQRLDYTLEAKLTGSTGIPGCAEMDSLVGESLPLTLRGTVTDPEIRPDFSEIIQRRLRDALQDRLQDRLRDLLR